MSDDSRELVPSTTDTTVMHSGLDALLVKIRPTWQARSLIQRVKRLVTVDPSSACQRVFNAAMHDMREKIVVAGLDIAGEAATANKLPPVSKPEDILDNYSTSNILDLAYHMGLLSRPEWKRLRRAYDIRRDLEHEDDEYEAGIEDCVYIFKSSVEIVLSRDPVQLLRVSDVKELIESPTRVIPSSTFISDYDKAPDSRQKQIAQFLVNTALDSSKVDVVRQNAVEALRTLRPSTRNTVKIELAGCLQERVKRRSLDLSQAKVAAAGGFLPYLKQTLVHSFFHEFHRNLKGIGYEWQNHEKHGDILDDLEDLGGLQDCPPAPRAAVVLWMTLCYLGEPGGYGTMGVNRPVFYSNAAAARIERILKRSAKVVSPEVKAAAADSRVKAALHNKHIARRYEALLDLTESDT